MLDLGKSAASRKLERIAATFASNYPNTSTYIRRKKLVSLKHRLLAVLTWAKMWHGSASKLVRGLLES
jgi:hypothetical protein